MPAGHRHPLSFIWQIDKNERLKVLLLGLVFFCIIGAYTLAKELKDSVFIGIVGEEYLPEAKFASMFVLVPAVLFYGYLVDWLKRYQLLYFYSIVYAIGSFIFAFFFASSTIGLANPVAHPSRLFGWSFYFFIEGYTPFLLSLFWAYANTISSPKAAQQSYPIIVSFSKVGGMATAGFGFYLFGSRLDLFAGLSEVARHQAALMISGLLLCLVPLFIKALVSRVPAQFLHGYEAVYKHEKEQEKKSDTKSVDVLSGLRLLFKYPYVLGIFGMIFFYEIIDTMLNFKRLILTKGAATCMNDLTCSLYGQVFYTHLFGFFLSFFGTNALLRLLGERWSLLCIPLFSLMMLAFYVSTGSSTSLILVYQGMTALNMAVSYPIREALYIPTVKEVRYKSKSWIDAFGTKLSKSLGSGFNKLSFMVGKSVSGGFFANAFGAFVAVLGFFWVLTAYLLGKRFSKAVERNEVIGADAFE